MKLKFGLYVSFFIVFVFIFTQIAFPVRSKVKSIEVIDAESSLPVFNEIKGNTGSDNSTNEYFVKDVTLKDIGDHHFVDYEINIESTMLIPVTVLNSKITVDDKYKDRVIARVTEPFVKKTSAAKKTSKKFKILVDTSGMQPNEVHEIIRNIGIEVSWKTLAGWERVNKVYMPEGTITVK